MKVGDKVKLIRGNPFGKVGLIKSEHLVAGPINLSDEPRGLKNAPYRKHFLCEADDGTKFSGTEDDLELTK